MRFGSRCPSEESRRSEAHAKILRGESKGDRSETSYAVVFKTKVSHFKVWKYIVKRHRWERKLQKNAVSVSGQRKAVLHKIVLRGFRGFPHTAEILAYFEAQPSSHVFEEFSGKFCTLYYTKENYVFKSKFMYFVNINRRFIQFEIGLSAPTWDLCWILPCNQSILLAGTDPRIS